MTSARDFTSKQTEIFREIDELADFAKFGQFLIFRSGPTRTACARLAFAMATGIQPDILLLNEGTGSGDAAFFERACSAPDGYRRFMKCQFRQV